MLHIKIEEDIFQDIYLVVNHVTQELAIRGTGFIGLTNHEKNNVLFYAHLSICKCFNVCTQHKNTF
jgi:hypothetical protein